jgi:hypothetical protein
MRSSTRFFVALQALGLVSALPSTEKPGIRGPAPLNIEKPGTPGPAPLNIGKPGILGRDSETYDYVIVGGGVTGLIVANRLTEDNKSGSDLRS